MGYPYASKEKCTFVVRESIQKKRVVEGEKTGRGKVLSIKPGSLTAMTTEIHQPIFINGEVLRSSKAC